jgi:hypothetical protein
VRGERRGEEKERSGEEREREKRGRGDLAHLNGCITRVVLMFCVL